MWIVFNKLSIIQQQIFFAILLTIIKQNQLLNRFKLTILWV